MVLNTSENVNAPNAHRPDNFSSNEGAPKGITVSKNINISPWPERSNPQPRIQRGGGRRRSKRRRSKRRRSKRRRSKRRRSRRRRSKRRRSRRRRSKRQRGGGVYGFNPEELPNFGKRGINWTRRKNGCGISSESGLGASKQHISLKQSGGGIDSLGHSVGGGEKISYGYDTRVANLAKDVRGSYAPINRTLRPQCAGKRRKTRRRKRRRRQRGGYHQYQSNKPLTSSYGVAGMEGGDWTLANPPPFTRTNNCRDNYNHYEGAGKAAPVLDQAAVY